MKHFLLFLIFSLVTIYAYSQKDAELNFDVRHVSSKFTLDGHQLFYALPKNKILIELRVKKTVEYAGPYRDYAEKFLNITDNVILADNEYYSIVDVKFHEFSVPDSNQFYVINCTGLTSFPILQLNSEGVILGCNSDTQLAGYSNEIIQMLQPENESPDFGFTDLGIKPFIEDKSETVYRIMQTDSTPTRVPVSQSKMVPTTVEQNADKAAAFIRKLRKRRLKLITGDKEESYVADGQAMKEMIEELDNYEQNYLELFMGKMVESVNNYYFEFNPDEGSEAEQQIIGWFSTNKGIKPNRPDIRRSDYQPLIIKAQTLGKIPETQIQVMDQSQKSPTPIKYGPYYRLPGRIKVSLQFSELTLAQQQFTVAQKGKILALPVAYLNNADYAIEFYPETGALKRIYKKSEK